MSSLQFTERRDDPVGLAGRLRLSLGLQRAGEGPERLRDLIALLAAALTGGRSRGLSQLLELPTEGLLHVAQPGERHEGRRCDGHQQEHPEGGHEDVEGGIRGRLELLEGQRRVHERGALIRPLGQSGGMGKGASREGQHQGQQEGEAFGGGHGGYGGVFEAEPYQSHLGTHRGGSQSRPAGRWPRPPALPRMRA